MGDRMLVSAQTRFAVFDRDNFTCQYCGRRAPSVTLELDHIHPVSKGGSNDFLNLTTSCLDCNRGKRARKLSAHQSNGNIEQLRLRCAQLEALLNQAKKREESGDKRERFSVRQARVVFAELTQREMSQCLGVSITTYFNYEHHYAIMPPNVLDRLSMIAKIPAELIDVEKREEKFVL